MNIQQKLGLERLDTTVAEEAAAFEALGPLTQAALASATVKFSAAEILHIALQNGMRPKFVLNDQAIAAVVAGTDGVLVREATAIRH